MTPVRMAHPNHGFMHAYSQDELEKLQKLGWSPNVAETPKLAEVVAEAPAKRKYTKRQAA